MDAISKQVYKKSICEKFRMNGIKVLIELDKLSKKEKDLLLKEYSFTDNELKEELTDKEREKNRDTIRKILSNNGKSYRDYISLFELFKEFSEEDILKLINRLSKSDIELLKKKYGEDFKNTKFNPLLTLEENYKVNNSIIHTLRKKLKEIYNGEYFYLTIDMLLPEYNKEEILSRVKRFNKVDKIKLHRYFGEHLDKECLVNKNIKDMLTNDVNRLFNTEKIIKIKPLYDVIKSLKLNNESKEEFLERFNESLNHLSIDELKLLKKKYGEDYSKTTMSNITKDENYYILHTILYKIRYYMNREYIIKQREVNLTEEKYIKYAKLIELSEYESLENKYGEKIAKAILAYKYLEEEFTKAELTKITCYTKESLNELVRRR